jgi:hypothetical protein
MAPRQIPQPFFKYLTHDRVKRILVERTIRFTQPRYLNDPYEMQLVVNPQSLKEDFVARRLADGATRVEAEALGTRLIEGLVFNMVDRIKEERDNLGVLSLSETPDGLLMWAHYGQDHRGAALGLTLQSCLLPNNPHGEALVWLDNVKYGREKIDFIKDRAPIWTTLLHKSEEWQYEKEWRIIRSLSTLRLVAPDIYVTDVWPSAIDCIILGARMSAQEETEILDLVEASPDLAHVEIFKALVLPDKLGLEIVPFEEWASRAVYSEIHFTNNWREIREWVNLKELAAARMLTDDDATEVKGSD